MFGRISIEVLDRIVDNPDHQIRAWARRSCLVCKFGKSFLCPRFNAVLFQNLIEPSLCNLVAAIDSTRRGFFVSSVTVLSANVKLLYCTLGLFSAHVRKFPAASLARVRLGSTMLSLLNAANSPRAHPKRLNGSGVFYWRGGVHGVV